jgi:mono/diheme cytochrome c family protein
MRLILAAALLVLVACERKAERPAEAPAKQADTAAAPQPVVPPPATVTDPAIARGEALVAANCVRCHATEPAEPSPHTSAPSFAQLFANYPPEYLQEAFAEGVFVGHGDMPAFEFTPAQINDMVAYLKTLGPDDQSG